MYEEDTSGFWLVALAVLAAIGVWFINPNQDDMMKMCLRNNHKWDNGDCVK